jgi:gluconolactonase
MFKHILMPTDGTEHSERAVERGIELAKLCGAKVTGIHVMPDYQMLIASEGLVSPGVDENMDEQAREQATRFLAFVQRAADEAGVPCETMIAKGQHPYDAIVDTANARGCDLIIMTARHRKGLVSLIMRSEASRVLHRASIPVLTFRALMSADHPDKPASKSSAAGQQASAGSANSHLSSILETTSAERLATGFVFTEGPLWHPDGFYYFVDIRTNRLYRLTPGKSAEVVTETSGGNGTTFDLQGRVVMCEGDGRRVVRIGHDGKLEPLVERFNGGRFNRPNDVVCRSDGSLYFTDPDKRVPYANREIPPPGGIDNLWDGACVYRIAPDGTISVVAHCEYPNGLAFSPDERTLYVANTRSSKYIHALDLDAAGNLKGRRVFADMNAGDQPGIPDGLKVDSLGRVYCTGPGGIWVFTPDGKRVGTIVFPEQAVNFAFGGDDLRTLFCCAHTSVYTLRVKVPGQPHPWYRLRK